MYYMATTVLAVILGIILVISIHPGVVGQEKVGLRSYTDKKENQNFLIYKEFQSGAVANSYMRKGFLIHEMRTYFPINEDAGSHIWLCNCSTLKFLTYEENLIFFFISVE